MIVSLQTQLALVRKDVAEKRRNYARLVSGGKMRRAEAELSLMHWEGVLRTLEWMWRNEEAVRGRVVASGAEDIS